MSDTIELALRAARAKAKHQSSSSASNEAAKLRPTTFHILANPNISFGAMEHWSKKMFELFLKANRKYINILRNAEVHGLVVDPNKTKPGVLDCTARLELGGSGQQNYHIDCTIRMEHYCHLDHGKLQKLYEDLMLPFSAGPYVRITHKPNAADNAKSYTLKYQDSYEL